MPTVDLIKSTTVVTTPTTITTTTTTITSTTSNGIISNNSITTNNSNNNNNNNNNNNFEQYQRLQLYNYALHIERFRGPSNNTHNSYPAAAAAAAAAMAAMAHTLHYTPTPTATNSATIMQPHQHQHQHQHRQQPLQHNHLTSSSTSTAAAAAAAATVGLHCHHNSLSNNKSLTAAAAAAAAAAAFSVRNMLPQHSRLLFQREEPKPQHSYIGLIAMAILSSAETKLVLSDIYQYILDNYPYFRSRGPGWRNSIRHNLSLNDCFVKSGRSANGKGHYWAIHPANLDDFRKGDFRRRKAQRKVRRHMGLSVDDGADSPSPPPPVLQPTTLQTTLDNTTATTALDLWQHNNPLKINAARAATLIAASLQQRHHTATNNSSSINNSIYTAVPMTYNQQMLNFQQHQISQPSFYYGGGGGCGDNFYSASRKLVDTTSSSTVIANFYSQTRKRQFDVASLLAPDIQQEETETEIETEIETEKLTQVVDRDLELDMETETNLRNSDTCSLESPPCISEPDTTDIMIDVVAHDDEELHKERRSVVEDEEINVETTNSKQRTYVYATFEVDKCDENKEDVNVGDDLWQHVPLTAAASYYEFVTTSHYLQQTQQAQPIQTTNETTTSASQHVLRHYCGSYMSQNTTAPPIPTTTPHLDDKLSTEEKR